MAPARSVPRCGTWRCETGHGASVTTLILISSLGANVVGSAMRMTVVGQKPLPPHAMLSLLIDALPVPPQDGSRRLDLHRP
jgi:hypothetical protein